MRSLALVIALTCSTATAAPVFVTKDNYKSAADSPFDLAGGYLEEFDDGLVNTPGVSIASDQYQFIAGGIGGGKTIQPTVVATTLDGLTNLTLLSIAFDEPWPTQVGFVTTEAAFPTEFVGFGIFPAVTSDFSAAFAPNRFFGVTDPDGIQAIQITMASPVPGEPFFQIDHLQSVPEPSAAVLLVIGMAAMVILSCRGHRDFRWLRAGAATLVMILVIQQAAAITTSGDPANYVVKAGTGRDGIVHIAAANKNFGTGTLLASGRHVWTASHIFETGGGATTADVKFELAPNTWTTVSATIAYQSLASPNGHDMVVLKLSAPAPLAAERYEPYRTSDEKGKVGQLVGYGQGGKGADGATPGIPNPWIKREGSNTVDDNTTIVGAIRMDFDSGNVIHDTLGKGKELGVGLSEACIATYDSGGPLLISGKLAGWAWVIEGPPGNSGFGQVMRHRRMSLYTNLVHDVYVPPVVTSVIMSRQSAPFANYTVPTGSGIQIRTIPVGGTNRIIVNFSEDVDPSVFVEVDGITSTYFTTNTWVTPRSLRIDIPGPLQRNNIPGDKLTLTLTGIKKQGATGASLDGDWSNPSTLGATGTSTFPSGTGDPGGSFVFRITVQPGDYDLNNMVDLTDFNNLKGNFGKMSGATYAEGDSNGDGKIDLTDYDACNQNFGVNWTSW